MRQISANSMNIEPLQTHTNAPEGDFIRSIHWKEIRATFTFTPWGSSAYCLIEPLNRYSSSISTCPTQRDGQREKQVSSYVSCTNLRRRLPAPLSSDWRICYGQLFSVL
jgi:hypothetical protein